MGQSFSTLFGFFVFSCFLLFEFHKKKHCFRALLIGGSYFTFVFCKTKTFIFWKYFIFFVCCLFVFSWFQTLIFMTKCEIKTKTNIKTRKNEDNTSQKVVPLHFLDTKTTKTKQNLENQHEIGTTFSDVCLSHRKQWKLKLWIGGSYFTFCILQNENIHFLENISFTFFWCFFWSQTWIFTTKWCQKSKPKQTENQEMNVCRNKN